jgi:hypothetical protein
MVGGERALIAAQNAFTLVLLAEGYPFIRGKTPALVSFTGDTLMMLFGLGLSCFVSPVYCAHNVWAYCVLEMYLLTVSIAIVSIVEHNRLLCCTSISVCAALYGHSYSQVT